MLTSNSLLRATAWATLVVLAAIVIQTGQAPLQQISLLLVVGGLTITGLNWYEHRGGRSPSFVFLILGCIFLCGRAFPALLGGASQLSRISFENEFDVGQETVFAYALLVLASFFLVHIGSLLPRPARAVLSTARSDAKIYLMIFAVFLPLYLYKNISYFNYILSSGGYLAIFQSDEFLAKVGMPIRIGALVSMAAFTLHFFHETDRKRSRWALVFFIVVFSSELLVGLRGKFFVITLMLFFFYKIRFGGKFSIRGLLALFAVIVALAIVVEVARQGGSSIEGSPIMGFLVQQGVTASVNLIVMDNPQNFAHNAGSYFLHQFVAPFVSQSEVPQGWFLANDISMQYMPVAYALGFGTGSSYLAELLLLGGWAGVCFGSFAIGWMLSFLSRFNQGVTGALMFWVVCGMVYYPRTMLQEPVHNLMRYAGPILFVAACCWLIQYLRRQKSR